MTSSVAQQLQDLQTPQTNLLEHKRKRKSILFSESECANHSRNFLFNIGHSGFLDLVKTNSSFEKFGESLFDTSKIEFQRSMQTKEVNDQLNVKIEEFLLLLSPILEKYSSLKALEWLIHRYQIEEMNVESLMMCIIPYYESITFVRIFKVMEINSSKSPWLWLHSFQQTGVKIPKQVIFQHWASSTWFRNFVSKYLLKILKLHNDDSDLRTGISFFITTQLGAILTCRKISENHISAVCQTMDQCFASKNNDLLTGYCVLLAQLSLSTTFSTSFINSIFLHLSQITNPEVMETAALSVLSICHSQAISNFSEDVLTCFYKNEKLTKHLKNIAIEKAVGCFFAPYCFGTAKYILENSTCQSLSETEICDRIKELFSSIQELNLSPSDATIVISRLLEGISSCDTWQNLKPVINPLHLWKELEKSHPEGCDNVHLSNFKCFFNDDAQCQEVQYLNETNLIHFLSEEDPTKLIKILKKGKTLLKTLGPACLSDHLVRILHLCRSNFSNSWIKVERNALELLVNKVLAHPKLDMFKKISFSYFLLSYVLEVQDNKNVSLATIIVNSSSTLNSFIPLLQHLKVEKLELSSESTLLSAKKWMSRIWKSVPSALSAMTEIQRKELIQNIQKKIESHEMNNISSLFLPIMLLKSMLNDEKKNHSRKEALELMFKICLRLMKCSKIEPPIDEEKKCSAWLLMTSLNKAITPQTIFFECFRTVLNDINLCDNSSSHFWTITSDANDASSQSLKRIIDILNQVIINQVKRINVNECHALLEIIFVEKLGSLKKQLYFLAMIFGWHSDIPVDIKIDSNLQFWALQFATSLVKSDSCLGWMLDPKEPLFLFIIPALCDEGPLCEAAFQLLQSIMVRPNISSLLQEDNFSPLCESLIRNKEEISSDVTYLPLTLATLVKDKPCGGGEVVNLIMKFALDQLVPLHLRCSALYLLSKVDRLDILQQLLPLAWTILERIIALKDDKMLDPHSSMMFYYIILRFSSKECSFIELERGTEIFLEILERTSPILQVTGTVMAPQDLVVNYKVLQWISGSDKQLDILDTLITRAVKANNPTEAVKLRRELKKLSIQAVTINSLLDRYDTQPKVGSIKEARAKRLQTQQNPQKSKEEDNQSLNWLRICLLVELIGVMEDLREPWLLLTPLSHHLKQSLEIESSATDVFQQQILSLLHHLIHNSIKMATKIDLTLHMNESIVVLCVQCIRQSVNPDTHRRALLILSMVSNFLPDKVLHNIMAIFTFMGNSLLMRDDSYSFQVIHETISSIVPTLIKDESLDPDCLLKKLAQVTQVFVDALPDLAEHRKLPLFTQLAETLGVSQYLWLVMVLIADACVMKGMGSKGVPPNIQFALLLYSQFSVIDQLKASCEVLNFACNLGVDKEISKSSRNSVLKVINVDSHTSKQLSQLNYSCIALLGHLISSERFVGQVYELQKEESGDIGDFHILLQTILKKVLNYVQVVNDCEEEQRGKPMGKFWNDIQRKLMDLIHSVNSLLPPASFVKIIKNLTMSSTPVIRGRAIEFLASKLQADSKFFSLDESDVLIPFIEMLINVFNNESEIAENKQIALFTLQLLIRFLGKSVDSNLIMPAMESSIKLISPSDSVTKVETQAIMVVAECVNVLKAHCIPLLGTLVPNLLNILSRLILDDSIASHAGAAATALYKIVEGIPQFVSKNRLVELLSVTCKLLFKHEESGQKEARICTKLTAIHEQLVEKIEPKKLINIVSLVFGSLSTESLCAYSSLMVFVEKFVGAINVSEIISYKREFIELFTSAFDVRQVKESKNSVRGAEECVISATSRFLLKLNEDDNNVIFSGFVNWAWSSQQNLPQRLTTFFRFANNQAQKLQDLFIQTKQAHRILDYAGKVLDLNNNVHNKSGSFGSGEEAEEDSCELLKFTLGTIEATFFYDRHEKYKFTTEERFNTIVSPLIDQIENTIGGEDRFRERITQHVKPCIIALTNALGDDLLWKELNRQLLLRIKADEQPAVILAALEVFDGLMDAKGEDYLQPLLADTMPCITEILESSDIRVQEKSKEIFNKMEQILGDNLRAYLDA